MFLIRVHLQLILGIKAVICSGVHDPFNLDSNLACYFGLQSVLDLLNSYLLEFGCASVLDTAIWYILAFSIHSQIKRVVMLHSSGQLKVRFFPG